MTRKKFITVAFILLTIANLAIFLSRDRFQYQPYRSYEYLYAACDKDCAKQWEKFVHDFPEKDLNEARKILDSANIHDSHFTFTKIIRIGNILYSRFHKQIGNPSKELLTSSPLLQYKKLCASTKEELWCSNFADMFSYFCWSEGIVCRIIEIMNPGDHHVVNECYLPETNEWVLVDLTSNMLLVKNKNNQLLNLLSFKDSLKNSSPVFALRAATDSIITEQVADTAFPIRTYYNKQTPLNYYHQINLKKVYTTAHKIKRYFFPDSWYYIFDGRRHSNLLFYVKDVFAIAWLLSFFIFIIAIAKFRI